MELLGTAIMIVVDAVVAVPPWDIPYSWRESACLPSYTNPSIEQANKKGQQ
jgi:hypothetical protein